MTIDISFLLLTISRLFNLYNFEAIYAIVLCYPCHTIRSIIIHVSNILQNACRSYSIHYILLCTFSAMGAVTAGVLDILKGQLPYNMWVPWDCTPFLLFWFTSLQKIVAVIVGTIVNVATETIVLGFSLQTCAQFEILKHRLQRIVTRSEEEIFLNSISSNTTSHKTNKLSEHVFHHLRIIRFVKQMIKLLYVRFFLLNMLNDARYICIQDI